MTTSIPSIDEQRPSTLRARRCIAGLIAVLTLAFCLRYHHIARDSLWGDEALTVLLAKMSVPELVKHDILWEQIPPVHHLLIKGWILLFGDSERSVRMPSLLAGVASVYMIFVLVARLIGRWIGLTAALLLAVNPMHIAYSQECRAYALHVLLGLCCVDAFVRLMRAPTPRLHAWYVISAALLMYTHIYGAFTLLGMHLFYAVALWRRPATLQLKWPALFTDDIALIALFAPWIPVVLRWTRQVQMNFWVKKVTIDDITRAYWMYSGQAAVFIAMSALVVIAIWRWRRREALWLLLAMMLTPVAVPVIISVLTRPSFAPRYAIMAVVPFVALAAAGVMALKPAPLRWLVLIALVVLSPAGSAAVIPRAQWREIGEFLTKNMRPGDLCVVQLRAGTRLYDYYVRTRPDVRRVGVDTVNLPVTYPLEPPGRRVWLVIYDSWEPATKMVLRAPVKIGKRKFTWGVLAMELIEDPEKLGATTTTAPAER